LEFNVPFQHKYGYIRDEDQRSNSHQVQNADHEMSSYTATV